MCTTCKIQKHLFPFHILDQISVRMPLHALAKLVEHAAVNPEEENTLSDQLWFMDPFNTNNAPMRFERVISAWMATSSHANNFLDAIRKNDNNNWDHGITHSHLCKLGRMALHGPGSQTKVELQKNSNPSTRPEFVPSCESWSGWNGFP